MGSIQKWEYKYARSNDADKLVKLLNELGQSGWELVNCIYTDGFYPYNGLLKRPIAKMVTPLNTEQKQTYEALRTHYAQEA